MSPRSNKCLTVGECHVAFDFGIVVPAKYVGFEVQKTNSQVYIYCLGFQARHSLYMLLVTQRKSSLDTQE